MAFFENQEHDQLFSISGFSDIRIKSILISIPAGNQDILLVDSGIIRIKSLLQI